MKTAILFVLFIFSLRVSAALFSFEYSGENPHLTQLKVGEFELNIETGRIDGVSFFFKRELGTLLVSMQNNALVYSFALDVTDRPLKVSTQILGESELHFSFIGDEIFETQAHNGWQKEISFSQELKIDVAFVSEERGLFQIRFEDTAPEPTLLRFAFIAFIFLTQRKNRAL